MLFPWSDKRPDSCDSFDPGSHRRGRHHLSTQIIPQKKTLIRWNPDHDGKTPLLKRFVEALILSLHDEAKRAEGRTRENR